MADEAARDELIQKIEEVLAGTWDALPVDVQDLLIKSVLTGTESGFVQLDISDQSLINDVNQVAADWARDRAAEMVGKRWAGDELVDNPDARWVVAQTTRDGIRDLVTKAFESPTPQENLIKSLQTSFLFSPDRAENIARTELKNAAVQGNWSTWEESGVVSEVTWLLSADADVCDKCLFLAKESPYPFSTAPKPVTDSHPRCRCSVVVTKFRESKKVAGLSKFNPNHGPGGKFSSGPGGGATSSTGFRSLKYGEDTEHAFRNKGKDGKYADWQPKREAMHDKVIDDLMAGHQTITHRKPVAFLLGGGSASGKGTMKDYVLAKHGFSKNEVVNIDPDEMKKKIPEFKGLQDTDFEHAAGRVHEESSHMAKRALTSASLRKHDLVYDGTGSSVSIKNMADQLKKAGYEVHGSYADVPVELAKEREEARSKLEEEKRKVDPDALEHAHYGAAHMFVHHMKDDPNLDSASLYDMRRAKEIGPQQVYERKGGGEGKVHDPVFWNYYQDKAAEGERRAAAKESKKVLKAGA